MRVLVSPVHVPEEQRHRLRARGKRTEGSTLSFNKIQVPEEVAKYQMEKLSDKFTTHERMSVI